MIKKVIASSVALCLGLGLVFGTDALSYVGTSVGWVKSSVKESVPVEFEIERARTMVRDLVPDIRKNMHVIAKEEVDIARLEKQIAHTESTLGGEREDIMRLKADLSSGKGQFVYAGRNYSSNQVKTDLAARFARYKTKDATLASLREIHNARHNSLSAARQKLDGMLAARRQLEVDLEHLEARLKMVEAAQTTSDYAFDDSNLSKAKQLVSDLRTRLDVAARMVNAEGELQGEIPLDDATPENVLDEVTEYFGLDDREQVADVGI